MFYKIFIVCLSVVLLCTCAAYKQAYSTELPKNIARQAITNSVKIEATCSDKSVWLGSGFAISPRKVATAGHVAWCDKDLAKKIVVTTLSGDRYLAAVSVYAAKKDFAILELKTDEEVFTNLLPVNTNQLVEKQVVCVYSGLHETLKCGTVKTVIGTKIYLNMKIIHGDSGSFLLNQQGEIIGMIVATIESANVGIATNVLSWNVFLTTV